MDYSQLVGEIFKKNSFLCVGLDTDFNKIPKCLQSLPKEKALMTFNKSIIDATAPYAVAFKPNVAFYESEGLTGWKVLADSIAYIKQYYPEILVIADAKRGDIGNTSERYAAAMFDNLQADAVTVVPYMGKDSVAPFLAHKGKWTIILALTSNTGSEDFQFLPTFEEDVTAPQIKCQSKGRLTLTEAQSGGSLAPLYEQVLSTASAWGSKDNTMFVIGATQAEMLTDVRKIVLKNFLLVPGVGAQGGSLEAVAEFGMTAECGLLVNSSRGIIYAGNDEYFACVAAEKAKDLQQQMAKLLYKHTRLYVK
ncbi:MAG: orotidine-5'-phosphate decarboxylase [Alphaproteobacteria bacterium]|nr:orotidine-5'-phosphate decarboxylase [Alphaproteobacteria bacterium]MBQ8677690.1 orotidine-5'-phosphate decarboxylase [Alphaproteobacteria bacterium]